MFDFHMHSGVSFDTQSDPREMLRAAEERGLREICFTDHYDYKYLPEENHDLFTLEEYANAYDGLTSHRVKVRRGVEFGLETWNCKEADEFLSSRHFDFVIGSVHYTKGGDPYEAPYWKDKSQHEAFSVYLEQMLDCVRLHSNYDVLGHMNYVCKSAHNPTHAPLRYEDYSDICDEIMRILVQKGKGMEINSSGVNMVGEYLPSADFLRRFRELGGEIVTIGSDAHNPDRVGQYADEGIAMLKDIFGYVCTFADRKPIFHKL